MNPDYQARQIESQVQSLWDSLNAFKVQESSKQEKYYCLCMFPYPSGNLHVGHVRNYTLGDVISRFQRMQGKNVLQPIGWDAFGLPAENAALKHQIPPAAWTTDNIAHMKKQLQSLGFAYDWSREFATCDPEYYGFEQWLFIKMFERGLVYKKMASVNWDPVDQTVLANEQVINGCGWRSGAPIERREIAQWFIKITDYAEELHHELEHLTEWPQQVRLMQKNWIGRQEGAVVQFPVLDMADFDALSVFTSRIDTLQGVTYLAVAPEHPIAQFASQSQPQLAEFIQQCRQTHTAEAHFAQLEKRGRATGLYARHPLSSDALPIYVANYVLMEYGSGAVMGVPAHDERDYEFAQKYKLPIKVVIEPVAASPGAQSHTGILINSGPYDGLHSNEASLRIIADCGSLAQTQINYRLRDWGVARQRYWGTPIPMIECPQCGTHAAPLDSLPIRLPQYSNAGANPLKSPEFHACTCPQCGGPARRETDTFDTFIESSWYYARFACTDNKQAILDERVHYWLPVDHYIGGIEHAVLHLLYARFFHKVMRDLNLVPGNEPFKRLTTQGMVLKDGHKMSKSKGNTVDPQTLIDQYGADTVRLFILFAAPPEQSLEWSDTGVEGAHRFLKRLWTACAQHLASPHARQSTAQQLSAPQAALRLKTHETLVKVSDDMQRRLTFNTAIAAIMELSNSVNRFVVENPQDWQVAHESLSLMVRMLAPMVPHISQALWQALGFEGLIMNEAWPKADEQALQRQCEDIVIQINGKRRALMTVPIDCSKAELENRALALEDVQRHLIDKTIRKCIVVPHRLLNFVTIE